MTAEQIARRYVDTLSDEKCRELLALAICAVCPALHSIATTSTTNRLNKMDDLRAVYVTPDFSELFNVGSNVGRNVGRKEQTEVCGYERKETSND